MYFCHDEIKIFRKYKFLLKNDYTLLSHLIYSKIAKSIS